MSKIGEVIHGLSKTSLCNVWYHILDRCYNSKSPQFTDYGGRGIKVSKKWKDSPIHFVNWAKKNGYKKGLEIDRKNNDGNYEPSNCRFVTRKQNGRNSSQSKVWFIKGKKFYSANQAAEHFRMSRGGISHWCKTKDDCWSEPLYKLKEIGG